MLATVVALMAFLEGGHTLDSGAFRPHVRRLLEFLGALPDGAITAQHKTVVEKVIDAVHAGAAVPGPWEAQATALLSRAGSSGDNKLWKQLAEALECE